MLFLSPVDELVSKLTFLKNKELTSQARQNVGPDLSPNCLQRLSANDPVST